MEVPGYTESEALSAIDRVVGLVAPSFKFGYLTVEDIKQQARLFALEGLPGYASGRPLENYLYRHIKFRLINFRRDKYRRNDPPCRVCHTAYLSGLRSDCDGVLAESASVCEAYAAWERRNVSKQNVAVPVDIDGINPEGEAALYNGSNTAYNSAINAELSEAIDEAVPASLRSTYLRMLEGVPSSKQGREAVETVLRTVNY